MNFFELPLADWTNAFVEDWLIPVLGGYFNAIGSFISLLLEGFQSFLMGIPQVIMALLLIVLAWRTAGKGVAIFTLVGLLYLGSVDLWEEGMQTLAIVLVATLFSLVIGIPVGIWSAKSDWVERVVRPILDFMQTLPSFVYLIPMILLFGIGGVSAVMATFVFATPPAVRLTNLGIRQVPSDVVEAAQAFGSTPWQILTKVQLPLALPTMMAGVNQTIMMALSMAVISAMIGASGLGSVVLSGISRVDAGLGLTGGLGIVVLAIILDRVTEGLGRKNQSS